MRGQLEIYDNYGEESETLLYKDSNVIVDRGGELLADVMTFPSPSLSGNSELSSLLDASNYTIQAISFGKAAKEYTRNAHQHPYNNSNISSVADAQEVRAFQSASYWNQGGKIVVSPWNIPAQNFYTSSTASGMAVNYPGGFALPAYADPLDTTLEPSALVPATSALSATFPMLGIDEGQNLNMLAYSTVLAISSLTSQLPMHTSGINDDTTLSSMASAGLYYYSDGSSTLATNDDIANQTLHGSGVWLGCYPQSSGVVGVGNPGTSALLVSGWTGAGDPEQGSWDPTEVIGSGIYISMFNSASSMDIYGFVGQHYCVSGNIAPNTPINPVSGLVISGVPSTSTIADSGYVAYMVTIGSGDLGCANLYGGITTAGLWGLNICKSEQGVQYPALISPNIPPLDFHPIKNQRRYKLFSKKVFNTNIASLDPQGSSFLSHKDLTLIWRLYFS